MTPGCTTEASDFRDVYEDFLKIHVRIFGLSKDSIASHQTFISKYNFPFILLADENTTLINALGAWQEKKFMGKTYMGTVRSTFVIHNGTIVREWRNVRVKNHAQEVLDFVKTL